MFLLTHKKNETMKETVYIARHGGTDLWSQHSGGGVGKIVCMKLAWTTQWVQGQPGQHSKTLFQKQEWKKEEKWNSIIWSSWIYPRPLLLASCVEHKEESVKRAICSDKEGKNPSLSLSDLCVTGDSSLWRHNAVNSLASCSRDVRRMEIMPMGCFAFRPISLYHLALIFFISFHLFMFHFYFPLLILSKRSIYTYKFCASSVARCRTFWQKVWSYSNIAILNELFVLGYWSI